MYKKEKYIFYRII